MFLVNAQEHTFYRDTPVDEVGLAFRRFWLTNILLRCPACAQGGVAKNLFNLKSHCDSCNASFERFPGNFLISIALNYFITSVVVLALGLIIALNYGFIAGLTELLLAVACITIFFIYRPTKVLTLWFLWVLGFVYPDPIPASKTSSGAKKTL